MYAQPHVCCSSSILYTSLTPTPSALYLLGLQKAFSSIQLHSTTLSLSTGVLFGSTIIPSAVANGVSDVLTFAHPVPMVVWLEAGVIRVAGLVPEGMWSRPVPVKAGVYEKLVDIGLGASSGYAGGALDTSKEGGMFVGIKPDGTGRLLRVMVVSGQREAEVVWEFVDSVSYIQCSAYVCIMSRDAKMHNSPTCILPRRYTDSLQHFLI
jgi:hypothetical protein